MQRGKIVLPKDSAAIADPCFCASKPYVQRGVSALEANRQPHGIIFSAASTRRAMTGLGSFGFLDSSHHQAASYRCKSQGRTHRSVLVAQTSAQLCMQ